MRDFYITASLFCFSLFLAIFMVSFLRNAGRYVAYTKYVLIHKWWVFYAGIQIGAPLWRLIIHDWHKFLPSEFFPYAASFYTPSGAKKKYAPNSAFDYAWNAHQKRAKHHWQHWVLPMDSGKVVLLEIPRKYQLEMVADWLGAGRAITGGWTVVNWYTKNKDIIQLAPQTRAEIESLLVFVSLSKHFYPDQKHAS